MAGHLDVKMAARISPQVPPSWDHAVCYNILTGCLFSRTGELWIWCFDAKIESAGLSYGLFSFLLNTILTIIKNVLNCISSFFMPPLALHKCLEITANIKVGELSSVNVSAALILTLIYVSIMSGACACENEQLIVLLFL